MSDPIFTENGSVQVSLSRGVEITFVPAARGCFRIHIDDPNGAHITLAPVTGEDMRAFRDATGMLVLRAVEQAA